MIDPTEFIGEKTDYLNLNQLEQGARIRVIAGELATSDQVIYDFELVKNGECPEALMIQTRSLDGEFIGPHLIKLEGSGRWTTPEQNPVQKQRGLAFSIGFGVLRIGNRIVVQTDPSQTELSERLELKPDIREIIYSESQN